MQLSFALWPCCAPSRLYHVYHDELLLALCDLRIWWIWSNPAYDEHLSLYGRRDELWSDDLSLPESLAMRPLTLRSVFFWSLQWLCLMKASSIRVVHCPSGPVWCSARCLGRIGLLRLGWEGTGRLTALGKAVANEYELFLLGKDMKNAPQADSHTACTWGWVNVL